jgi:DNA repair protein RecO (recombination protein O)
MRIALNPCYFLHLRPYRETSLLCDVLSRDHGRLTLVARGARRVASRQAGLYQPMAPVQLAWSLRGEMGTVTAIEQAAPARLPTGRRLIAAFYLNELLVRLLHRHEAHPELYDAYQQALAQLALPAPTEEPVLRIFEKQLLVSLGYGLVLDHEVDGGATLEPERIYHYLPGRGPGLRPTGAAGEVAVSGAALLALDAGTLHDERHVQECRHLMRALLGEQLGSRPLASRDLYRRMFSARTRA